MNTKKKMIFKSVIIISLVTIFVSILSCFNVFHKLNLYFYDFLIKLTPNSEVDENIVFVNVDDYSVYKLGSTARNKDLYVNTLIRMKELGAKSIVLDANFIDSSIKSEYIANLNKIFASDLLKVNSEKLDSLSDIDGCFRRIKKTSLTTFKNDFDDIFDENDSIPLDENNFFFINWQHPDFFDSFRHNNIYFITQLDEIENNIYSILIQIDEIEFLGSNECLYKKEIQEILLDYKNITEYRNQLFSNVFLSENEYNESYFSSEYFELKKNFFKKLNQFSKKIKSNELIELKNYLLSISGIIGSENVLEYSNWFEEAFNILDFECELYNKNYENQKKKINNSFCFIGNATQKSKNLITTPFFKKYPSIGLYANIYNTILTEKFITPVSWWYGTLISFVLTLILIGFVSSKKISINIILGTILILFNFFLPIVCIIYKNFFVPNVAAILLSAISFVFIFVFKLFFFDNRKYINSNGFDTSKKVDNSFYNNNFEPSALFSDIKNFLEFADAINNEELQKAKIENEKKTKEKQKSEKRINANAIENSNKRLFSILNGYFECLGNAIENETGIIDKYIGDKILSFFGIPISDEMSAYNACIAGIRMLKAEEIYNNTYKDSLPKNKLTNESIFLKSTICINTGNMIFGNLNTNSKFNYTVMGNNVKIASCLKSKSKIYGSRIIITEDTWDKACKYESKGKLIARMLDVVKINSMKKNIRIVSLIGIENELSDEQIKSANYFNEGMKWYMKGIESPELPKDLEDFRKAYIYYKKANELYPDDKSARLFMSRCANLLKNGITGYWDGVYTMTSK